MIKERETATASGWLALALLLPGLLICAGATAVMIAASPPLAIVAVLAGIICLVCLGGLFMVNPNEAKVLQLFGSYMGTARTAGLRWANPFYSKKTISLRVRNFESSQLKVNDHDGNPIEIAAIIVWRVIDTAEAAFEVDDYQNYVHVQSESAVRNLASRYSYDAHDEKQLSLRANTAEVAEQLKGEIQDRLAKAGVEVLESRLSHLAYAPEIAQVMLRRQQGVGHHRRPPEDRRRRGHDGRNGADHCSRRATSWRWTTTARPRWSAISWSCSAAEREAQPVVNAGTIYQ